MKLTLNNVMNVKDVKALLSRNVLSPFLSTALLIFFLHFVMSCVNSMVNVIQTLLFLYCGET